MTFFVAGHLTPTNVALVDACRSLDLPAALLPLEHVHRRARPGDVVLPRLDIVPTLDGIEPGLDSLRSLERRGVFVVNSPGSILAAHDKLATALKLGQARVPHPATIHVDAPPERLPIAPPLVVKPRFGSWGRDVVLCRSGEELAESLRSLSAQQWFRRQGALVQELIPPVGHDLRVLVAGTTVVGAIRRVAAEGEWRTNVALGGTRARAVAPPLARAIAVDAAAAIGARFVGVDLLPRGDGFVVLELNGCVDFTAEYAADTDVFATVVDAIAGLARERERSAARAQNAPRLRVVRAGDAALS